MLDTFVSFGFLPLVKPLLRQTLARRVTIHQACRTLGVDEHRFLDALNAERDRREGGHRSLPVISVN